MCIKSNDPDPTFILRSGPHSVSCVKFVRLRSGKKPTEDVGEEVLLSGSQDGFVTVWNMKTKRVKFKLRAAEDDSGVLFADLIRMDNEDVILTHTRNGSMKFWVRSTEETNEWVVKREGVVYEYGYCPIAVHQHCSQYYLAYPSSNNAEFSVTLIHPDLSVNPLCAGSTEKWGIVMHLRLFTRGPELCAVAGYESGDIAVWSLTKSPRLLHSLKVHNDPVMCLDIDSASFQLISGSADQNLLTHRLDENFHIQKHMSHESLTSGFACSCVRGDSRIVVCGGWGGKVRVFAWKKMKPLAILKFHSEI